MIHWWQWPDSIYSSPHSFCHDSSPTQLHALSYALLITLALDFCYADTTIHRVIVHLIHPQLIFQQCCHKVVNTGLSHGCCSGLTGGGGLSGIDCS